MVRSSYTCGQDLAPTRGTYHAGNYLLLRRLACLLVRFTDETERLDPDDWLRLVDRRRFWLRSATTGGRPYPPGVQGFEPCCSRILRRRTRAHASHTCA